MSYSATYEEFVDYYALLGLAPTSTPEQIKREIMRQLKEWHPDRCRHPDAHTKTVQLTEAKAVLMESSMKAEYDQIRRNRQAGRASHQSAAQSASWERRYDKARVQAAHDAELSLEDILAGFAGLAAAGITYSWQGSEKFMGRSGPPTGTLIWAGIGGWACVICLAVPGTSIITFFCFYWAFFPGPSKKFIGLGNVVKGMLISGAIILPILVCLGGALINSLSR